MLTRHRHDGFSLVETIVAVAVMTSALVMLAALFATATANNLTSQNGSAAAILAQQKMEQLRADVPLSASPAVALRANTIGWVDYLDERGSPIDADVSPPAGTVFIRRWSVDPIPATDTWLLQVLVTPYLERRDSRDVGLTPGEAWLASAKRR